MNNSRFKFFLIPNEELPREAKALNPRLEKTLKAFDDRHLTISEMLFAIIAIVCDYRKPGQWWMKGKSEFQLPDSPNVFLKTLLEELGLPVPVTSLASFFSHCRLKNLPHGVSRILYLWGAGQADLELSDTAITPQRMLALQAEGRRIVTLSRKSLLAGELVDGKRDALEFLLHDMAHANLFFSETHQEQRVFFKTLLVEIERKDLFAQSLEPNFKTSLEYIMSDMNSSEAHLKHSLKAALIEKCRSERNISAREQLAPEDEMQLKLEWAALW